MEMSLQVFIEKTQHMHHVITRDVSLQVFVQLETLSEQRRKSKLCRTCFMTVPKCIYGNNKPML